MLLRTLIAFRGFKLHELKRYAWADIKGKPRAEVIHGNFPKPYLKTIFLVFIGAKEVDDDISYEEEVDTGIKDNEFIARLVIECNAKWHVWCCVEKQYCHYQVPVGLKDWIRVEYMLFLTNICQLFLFWLKSRSSIEIDSVIKVSKLGKDVRSTFSLAKSLVP